MVRERSAERRSKKLGHWASPTISRAHWNRTLAATGSPIVRSAPRTRTAGANPASKWRSLAPCSLAAPTKDSRFIGWPVLGSSIRDYEIEISPKLSARKSPKSRLHFAQPGEPEADGVRSRL